MLLPMNQNPVRPTRGGRRTKGPRAYVGVRVLPSTITDLDIARARDEAMVQAAPRPMRLREAVTRNNWVTAAVLAAHAAGANLVPLIEWGNRSTDRELLAVRVAELLATDIDQRRAVIQPPLGAGPVTRPQWVAAAVFWALDQPPGVVAAQLVNVPRRDHRGPGQQSLEVFAAQAG